MKPIGHVIREIDLVDSTSNFVAKGLIDGKIVPGEVIMAYYQTTGRGQHGRFWQSAAGKNLLFSFAIPVPAHLHGLQFLLSKAISLGIVHFLDHLKLSAVKIKWPNDVLVDRRKIAGMLLEFKSWGIQRFVIVGIGLNLNENFEHASFRATSIESETGYQIVPSRALDTLLGFLNHNVLELIDGNPQLIESAYFRRLYGAGEWIEFVDKERSYQGMIQSVDAHGQLIVKSKQGYTGIYQPREVRIGY